MLLMSDEQLSKYLPLYGDHLAVLSYCKRKDSTGNSRQSKLFERLKLKLGKKKKPRTDNTEDTDCELNNRRKTVKESRKIEIGWMLYEESQSSFVQVPTKRGGGTRKLEVPKEWKKDDLLKEGIRLFFPNGKNSVGNLDDSEFNKL